MSSVYYSWIDYVPFLLWVGTMAILALYKVLKDKEEKGNE